MTKLAIIAPAGEPQKRPRLEKLVRLAHSRGYQVQYWGWAREESDRCGAGFNGIEKARTLLRGGGYFGTGARLRYPLWVMSVLVGLLRHRPQVVWAVGLETALPTAIAAKITGLTFVFDDPDRFVLLFSLPRSLKAIVTLIEQRVSRAAAVHVVPGFGRYDYRTTSMTAVGNVPDAWQISKATEVTVERPQAELVVYINGWIAPTRGLEFLTSVATALRDDSRICFIIASKRGVGDVQRLIGLPNVMSLGSLDQVGSLAWYRVSELVVTFYDPAVPINRYAEPNKWGDAAMMGTAVLVNSEVKTASEWLERGAAFSVPWNDVHGTCLLLQRLAESPVVVEEARSAARSIGRSMLSFDVEAGNALDKLRRSSDGRTKSR